MHRFAISIAACAALLTPVSRAAAADISFNRQIRSILSANCFSCHGPDAKGREADLRLDTREGATAVRDGEAAIVPGAPERSLLIERITSTDNDLRMPPVDSEKNLSAEQIRLLRDWIAQGAGYEPHWSFMEVRRPEPPAVKDEAWARNPIDRFVLAAIERQGLTPSPSADRYVLMRRVYLDLLGLPPSAEAVDAFVSDEREDAYERMVDAALASPHFGERWGRHWLDQARYADSHGYTNDNERSIWPYRDWVIDAFNRDLPFDEFTIEQLAGDLLPDATIDQLVATGFHRNTLINTEGGTKADQFRDEQVKDRVDTTGSVWLGLTVGCAKCHSHKYDPLAQSEYYGLYAFFNSTADNNSITPTVAVLSREDRQRLVEAEARIGELEKQIAADKDRAQRQTAWEQGLAAAADAAADGDNAQPSKWIVLEGQAKSLHQAEVTNLDDKSLLFAGKNEPRDEYQFTANSPLTSVRSVRLEMLRHESLPSGGPGRAGNGNFVLSEFWFRTSDGRELRFSHAEADHSQPKYGVAGAIDGNVNSGWAINGSPEGGANHDRTAWFVLPAPLEVEAGDALTFTLQFNNGAAAYNAGRLRLSVSAEEYVDTPTNRELAAIAIVPAETRSPQQQQRLDRAFQAVDPKLAPLQAELGKLARERDAIKATMPTTMVMRELDNPRQAHVQIKGDFLRTGDPVSPGVPAALPAMSPGEAPLNRLDLARWLVDGRNPLTARVRANRIWMRLFGAGLVATDNDFGAQGAAPTHPELLDWLASEFVDQGWSTKKLLRLIVASATYRQASIVREQPAAVDPKNTLLWRQNRVRVDAEIVRDMALSACGRLSPKIGGASVFPPQPAGVYAYTQRAMRWPTSQGEDRYRRGLYTFLYRSAPYPMLTTFDTPPFNQTCTRRDRSNTPLQALTVANDEAFFEMDQALAARLWDESKSAAGDDERLTRMFRLCLTRPPGTDEIAALRQFLESQRNQFGGDEDAAKRVAPAALASSIGAAEAAAWVATARVLLNLDEFITRE
ncbi:MAG: PSD1 domain-containing protein [Planctomycetales bacterium]|nr:PSD1 domain-containing protein [Planctomycetales bacterium]